MPNMKHFPIEVIYGIAAIAGGIARYLNSYTNGEIFSLRIFLASTFVSGFSGYMFAVLGQSLEMPPPFIFMMAGSGGFFGDQTMKFIKEVLDKRFVK